MRPTSRTDERLAPRWDLRRGHYRRGHRRRLVRRHGRLALALTAIALAVVLLAAASSAAPATGRPGEQPLPPLATEPPTMPSFPEEPASPAGEDPAPRAGTETVATRDAPPAEAGSEAALAGVAGVHTGLVHSCALVAGRQVRCWGSNGDGQLGDESVDASPTPVTVRNRSGTGPLRDAIAVAAGGRHTCALLGGGQVRCWGSGGSGQLGDGAGSSSRLPVVVRNPTGTGPLRRVVALSAGTDSTCARLADGQVRCWGRNNQGELGNGTDRSSFLPVVVRSVAGSGPLTRITQVTVGDRHACARRADGQARCWGDNEFGRLGTGTTARRLRPAVVRNGTGTGPLTGVRQVSAGGAHTCAALADGTARCWGRNTPGRLGDGTTEDRVLPVAVVSSAGMGRLTGVHRVLAGERHSCALQNSGQVRCWGDNGLGQLGDGALGGPARQAPAPVRDAAGTGRLTGVAQLQTSWYHVCVRLQNGQARCWGRGQNGQLGNGQVEHRPLPVAVIR